MGARLLLAAAVVSVLAALASANIRLAGPYAADTLEVSPCDDGEYPGLIFNVSLVVDEETNETTYRGNITFTYDILADDCELQITFFRWGSTGGWSQFYFLNYTNPFDYSKANFPLLFKLLFEEIGVKEKPLVPGTYYVHRFMPKRITLKKFSALPYGEYKLYAKSLTNGEALFCLQGIALVYEIDDSQAPNEIALVDSEVVKDKIK